MEKKLLLDLMILELQLKKVICISKICNLQDDIKIIDLEIKKHLRN